MLKSGAAFTTQVLDGSIFQKGEIWSEDRQMKSETLSRSQTHKPTTPREKSPFNYPLTSRLCPE